MALQEYGDADFGGAEVVRDRAWIGIGIGIVIVIILALLSSWEGDRHPSEKRRGLGSKRETERDDGALQDKTKENILIFFFLLFASLVDRCVIACVWSSSPPSQCFFSLSSELH